MIVALLIVLTVGIVLLLVAAVLHVATVAVELKFEIERLHLQIEALRGQPL